MDYKNKDTNTDGDSYEVKKYQLQVKNEAEETYKIGPSSDPCATPHE